MSSRLLSAEYDKQRNWENDEAAWPVVCVESWERKSFLLRAHIHNSCSLLIKTRVALVFLWAEGCQRSVCVRVCVCLCVSVDVCVSARTQPWQATDWWLSKSRMLHGCYRLAQRKPGTRSALSYTSTHTYRATCTYFIPPSPQYQTTGRTSQNGGLMPACPPHLVCAWTCQVSFLSARM